MVPQICDIKLTGGKKLQVREVSDYFFSPIFPLSFRNDSMIGVLKSHCSGSKCQISGGQKDPYFQLKYFNQVRVVRSLMNNNP